MSISRRTIAALIVWYFDTKLLFGHVAAFTQSNCYFTKLRPIVILLRFAFFFSLSLSLLSCIFGKFPMEGFRVLLVASYWMAIECNCEWSNVSFSLPLKFGTTLPCGDKTPPDVAHTRGRYKCIKFCQVVNKCTSATFSIYMIGWTGWHGSIKYGPIRVLFLNRELRIAEHYLRSLSESYINI